MIVPVVLDRVSGQPKMVLRYLPEKPSGLCVRPILQHDQQESGRTQLVPWYEEETSDCSVVSMFRHSLLMSTIFYTQNLQQRAIACSSDHVKWWAISQIVCSSFLDDSGHYFKFPQFFNLNLRSITQSFFCFHSELTFLIPLTFVTFNCFFTFLLQKCLL